jgi:hypothetical protein
MVSTTFLNSDVCALCGNNKGIRKRSFFLFNGQMQKRVCVACILKIGSGQTILELLEKKFPKLEDGREERFKKNGGGQL